MCGNIRTYVPRKGETTSEVKHWFQAAVGKIWPVAEGSLSLRKSPCIRKNCPACARGEGHLSYVLYGRRGKRRFSIYVPGDLVSEVQAALKNGRELQELMNEAGVRYMHAIKLERLSRRRE
jgi:hypothetical protein